MTLRQNGGECEADWTARSVLLIALVGLSRRIDCEFGKKASFLTLRRNSPPSPWSSSTATLVGDDLTAITR